MYTEKTMFCDGEGFSKFFTDDMGDCCCFFFYYYSPAPRYVLLNMHNLLHLVEDVKANGPLWCNSLFVFEDWNGDITDFFHGTQSIPNQVNVFRHTQDLF